MKRRYHVGHMLFFFIQGDSHRLLIKTQKGHNVESILIQPNSASVT